MSNFIKYKPVFQNGRTFEIVYNTPDLFNINDSGLLCRCRVPGISGALCADNNGLCLAGTLLKGGGRPRFFTTE